MKEKSSKHFPRIILSIAQITVAVLLLISPERFTAGIIIAIGLLGMISGIGEVIRYVRMAPVEAAKQQLLSKGLLSILLGWFAVSKSVWFITVFPLLAVLYGIVVLVVGVTRVQWAADMFRMGNPVWKSMAVNALISVAMGSVIVLHPFATSAVLWSFVAITLLINAVLDMLNVIMEARR